jgi:hypothetical protein
MLVVVTLKVNVFNGESIRISKVVPVLYFSALCHEDVWGSGCTCTDP